MNIKYNFPVIVVSALGIGIVVFLATLFFYETNYIEAARRADMSGIIVVAIDGDKGTMRLQIKAKNDPSIKELRGIYFPKYFFRDNSILPGDSVCKPPGTCLMLFFKNTSSGFVECCSESFCSDED